MSARATRNKTSQKAADRLAILPGVLMREIIPTIDATLKAIKETLEVNAPPPGASVMDTFRRMGADDWDALRRDYSVNADA